MIGEYKNSIYQLKENCDKYLELIDVNKKKEEISQLEKETESPDFWADQKSANSIMKKLNSLKKRIAPWERLNKEINDLVELYEIALSENSEEYENEIKNLVDRLNKEFSELEFKELLSDENDRCNAILNIHPGAGGTESCDWAAMLYRMYTRWAEKRDTM